MSFREVELKPAFALKKEIQARNKQKQMAKVSKSLSRDALSKHLEQVNEIGTYRTTSTNKSSNFSSPNN